MPAEITHQKVDSKLYNLEYEIDRMTGPIRSDFKEWERTFELIKELQDDFKIVRYPTKDERDIAWRKFYNLRDKAYQERREDFTYTSTRHYDELWGMLRGLDYSRLREAFLKALPIFELSSEKERMIRFGKELNQAAQHFSSVKREMIVEHKTKIHERIIEIRESHDFFWNEYNDRREELRQLREERQQAWEEKRVKSREKKESIKANIEKNEEKLDKAKNALDRFETTQRNLEDKISDAYSNSFRERHQEWLDEVNEKISSVREQIERLEKWIREDEEKLENWRE